MYDINLLDKSKNKVQPDGMVEVSVKLSDNMKMQLVILMLYSITRVQTLQRLPVQKKMVM